MGVQTRGTKSKKGEANGHLNGGLNGHIGPGSGASRKHRPRRSIVGGLANMAARLFVWYAIFIVAFRCPANVADLTDESSRLCKPYLTARSRAVPYIEPYYDTYLAPYADQARPYIAAVNDNVYAPAATFAKHNYEVYGAPRVAEAQAYVMSEWDRVVLPQFRVAEAQVKAQYEATLAPHVSQAQELVAPYYDQAKQVASDVYQRQVLPAYDFILPHAQNAYAQGHHVTVHFIAPYAQRAHATTMTFLTRSFWPQIRALYGENVEPQLIKIGERLGRYKDGKIESVISETESTPTEPSTSSEVSSPTSTTSENVQGDEGDDDDDDMALWPSDEATPSKAPRKRPPKQPREKLNHELCAQDLRDWQKKFANAADKGSDDLRERVEEISKDLVETQIHGTGESLITQLEERVKSGFEILKEDVKSIVTALPEDLTEESVHEAYEKVSRAAQAAGLRIREKALDIRNWKTQFDKEAVERVKAASTSTLEVLDDIYNLGLSQIGMKWAWSDGVTYKDWAKYNEMKGVMQDWKKEVSEVAWQHERLQQGREEAVRVEEQAMAIAEDAAKELRRLKDAARWKIHTQDASDDFSSKAAPPPVYNAAKKAAEEAEAANEAFQDAAESVATAVEKERDTAASAASSMVDSASGIVTEAASEAADEAQSVVSAAKEKASDVKPTVGTPEPPPDEVVKERASASGESLASAASEAVNQPWVPGGAMAFFVEAREPVLEDALEDELQHAQSVISEAGDKISALTDAIFEALGQPTSTQAATERATSIASEQYAQAMSAGLSMLNMLGSLYGTEDESGDSSSRTGEDSIAQAMKAASKLLLGKQQPPSRPESLTSEASRVYEEATSLAQSQYSVAKSRLSGMIQGTPQPVHQQMLQSAESAYSGAINTAQVSLSAALSAASGLSPIRTPGPLDHVSSIANSRLSEGLSAATAQFSSAKSVLGATPTPAHQRYLADAQQQYYQAIGIAHARYSEFIDSASTAIYGSPTPALEGYMSAAQSHYSSAVSVASENLDAAVTSAKSAAGSSSTGPVESIIKAASAEYEAAVAAASHSLSLVASKASTAMEGAPTDSVTAAASKASEGAVGSETPWTESAASQLAANWESLVTKASEQVYGQPTPFAESVLHQAGAYGAQATDAAISQYDIVQSLVSELIVGKEPDFTQSVMSRLSSAYYTGYPDAASAASSYADNVYSSAASAASAMFTPPPTIEAILDAASDQFQAAVDGVSVQIYGSEPGYFEAAQSSVAAVASSAHDAVSSAIYGTPTGSIEAATSGMAQSYSSAVSAASESVEAAKKHVSSMVYGPEQGAMESAASRLSVAAESAKARLSDMVAEAGGSASEQVEQAKEKVEEMASKAAEAVTGSNARDEL